MHVSALDPRDSPASGRRLLPSCSFLMEAITKRSFGTFVAVCSVVVMIAALAFANAGTQDDAGLRQAKWQGLDRNSMLSLRAAAGVVTGSSGGILRSRTMDHEKTAKANCRGR